MRVAIIVGHSAKHGGATAFDGSKEHAFNAPLAAAIAEALPEDVERQVFFRGEEPYRTAIHALIAKINAYKPALVLSLHSNAMPEDAKGKGTGTMALFWPGSRLGKQAATVIAAAAAKAIGIKNKGAVSQARSWAKSRTKTNGKVVPDGPFLYVLQKTTAPAVILESHFLDTETNHTKAIEARDSGKLPKNVANAIMEVLSRNSK